MNEPSQPDKSGIHVTTKTQTAAEHDFCEAAPEKEKCRAFVERLSDAANNIDRQK